MVRPKKEAGQPTQRKTSARGAVTARKATTRRTRSVKVSEKPIEQYDHKHKQRLNNPPVGLVSEKTDKDAGKKTYRYDPHIDPELQFDHQRSQIEKIIDDGLAAEKVEQAKAALTELNRRQEPTDMFRNIGEMFRQILRQWCL